MGTLYLVRHGQASFGADDYDRLSELGHKQCLRLGQHLRAKGLKFEAVLTGTLLRHRESLASLAEGMQCNPQSTQWPALDEYDSVALLRAVDPQPLPRPDTPQAYRHHFRLLRRALAAWMSGATRPQGMPSYAEFVAGINGALDHVRQQYSGDVLIVSSGGPIATAVGQVLGTAPETTIELNLRIRNASVTEFAFTPKRHMLVSYNGIAHLDAPEYAHWVTFT